jgi:Sulfotransferase family
VFMPAVKELDFFVLEGNWARGLQWYAKQFAAAGQTAVAVGEASTMYTKYPSVDGVPKRIAAYLPGVRLIYVVRDPIERIRSHYRHRVAVGAETESFERAVIENPIYLDCSRYAVQVDQYLKFFPRSQLLIVPSEDLRHSRLRTIRWIYSFLGVDSEFTPETLDREFLRTDERPVYSPFVWRFRHAIKHRWPSSKRAKEIVDSSLPGSISRVAGRRDAYKKSHPVPDPVRSDLEELLKEDVSRLCAYVGDGFDGWGIA